MKRSLISLIASAVLVGVSWLTPHSLFQVKLETAPSTTAAPTRAGAVVAPAATTPITTEPGPVVTLSAETTPELAAPARDPLGELYFTITGFEHPYRLAHLPGSCVAGLAACPEAQIVATPFSLDELTGGLRWSPDGRAAVAVTHAPDDLSDGKTAEELEEMAQHPRADYQVSPSILYRFEPESGAWQQLAVVENKFVVSEPVWSQDGQWLAFQVRNSPWGVHPSLPDDGLYVLRSDGTGLQQVAAGDYSLLGWVGSSLIVQQYPASPVFPRPYRVMLIGLDGTEKPLFDSERAAYYQLSPDGGAFLATDAHVAGQPTPQKSADLLALDGSTLQPLGTYGNTHDSLWPAAWSPDGSWVTYGNLGRVYLAARDGEPHQIYQAENPYGEPRVWGAVFSPDSRYLLLEAYDGMPYAVTISIETGQAQRLNWEGMTDDDQASNFSWRP